ncbi:MAG: hypothetical protein ABI744_01575 [Chloroflexota bacterium]
MTDSTPSEAPRKRLDQMVAPGWARTISNVSRGVGIVVGVVLLWLGVITGGFFLVLCGVLALVAIVGGWLLGSVVQRETWYERANAQPMSWALVVLFPLMLVVVAQLAGPLLTPAAGTSGTLGSGQVGHEEKVFPLALDPRVQQVQFTISFDGNDGPMRWFVQDPTGQSLWGDRSDTTGAANQRFTSNNLRGAGGQWTFHIINEGTKASYSVTWQGSTSP